MLIFPKNKEMGANNCKISVLVAQKTLIPSKNETLTNTDTYKYNMYNKT